ncbi:thioredoxin domain-containing protein [Cochleicola gelatinilyticus]|uniref:Glutaredoxin domain-containing protein n=1 Tax=Cochleicola gelatinilyticus TaxID=1763537 RepID=A0A167GY31_9FLAO|nr:hypothetical protein [Cochleicola gelatinilyticus]OAB78026.1 hypothetical protein ULVI_11105 [Cochleicola gelatinilyticus]
MRYRIVLLLIVFGVQFQSNAQDKPITIEAETVANRMLLYAVNQTLTDYDAKLEVEGTNFRQSKGKPRWIHVPAASKVHMHNLMLTKGKQPNYTYTLEINDSLSRRALKKPAEAIKIDPKKPILVYRTKNCTTCDALIHSLNNSKYRYTMHDLAEKPAMKEQLSSALPGLDTIATPVISLGGLLYTDLETYDAIIEKLNKEE